MAKRVWLAEGSQPGDGFPIHQRLMKSPNGILKGAVISILMQAATLPALAAGAGAVARPNVIVILADAPGHGDAGWYGARPEWGRTPNIDRPAHEGIRFTDENSTDTP